MLEFLSIDIGTIIFTLCNLLILYLIFKHFLLEEFIRSLMNVRMMWRKHTTRPMNRWSTQSRLNRSIQVLWKALKRSRLRL